jgi:branched-chain amino acid transport system ATP-binding protein
VGEIILETRGLTKKFGANVAVSDVSLAVEAGIIHCIIGPNGAGKTTLFNLLTKDLQPSSGTMLLAGQDITLLKPHEISRRGVGRSYQITSVFPHMSVRDNVWVATYRHRRAGRFNFWSSSGAYPDVDMRTDEILAEIGVGAVNGKTLAGELSYGDQRLLEIAIALATSPRLLLFDEPMSGLSEEETRRVSELIRALGTRYTVVMIEHKMNVVMSISDRITVMNFGKVIADGLPVEVAADADVKRAYFGT